MRNKIFNSINLNYIPDEQELESVKKTGEKLGKNLKKRDELKLGGIENV